MGKTSDSVLPIDTKSISYIPYTLYYGTFIDTPELGKIRISFNTLVGVDQTGRIDYIYRNYKNDSNDILEFFKTQKKDISFDKGKFKCIDFSKETTKFFMPGFVDTHIHASQYPNVGLGLGVPLLDWLKTFTFPLENQFGNRKDKISFAIDIYSKVIERTLLNGTTCASYFAAIDTETTKVFADLLLKIGQRGFVGKVCMDHNDPYPQYEETTENCKKSTYEIIEYVKRINPDNEILVKPIITPRFAPVCTRELLLFLGETSQKHDLPIQTHISENKGEIELVNNLFPDCENYAEVYNSHGLLQESTILAHAIHLDEKERSVIKEKGCSISHCPTSNSFISSGQAPIRKYLYDDHINVSLGTDLSGGFDSSILGVIKNSILVSHHVSITSNKNENISINDAIYMATQGGAKAVGMPDIIGTFDIGKKFDAQLINVGGSTSSIDIFEWQIPQHDENLELKEKKMVDLLGKWVFCGDDRNCCLVWCNGRLVLDKLSCEEERWVLVDH